MTKLKRKIGAILLTLAMVFTMMPAMALTAFAADSDKAFDVAINGTVVRSVSKTWMAANNRDAQIFPFAGKYGKKGEFKYVIAEGPSYETTLKEALGIESLDEIANAKIEWLDEPKEGGSPVNPNGFKLSIMDLQKATTVFKLTNGTTDAEIAGSDLSSEKDLYAVSRSELGYQTVTPIIAINEKEYATFDTAKSALENQVDPWSSDPVTDIRAYVGGIIRADDVWLKKDGDPNGGKSFNWVGKFSISNPEVLNVNIDLPSDPEKETVTMTVGDSPKKLSSSKYTDKELELLDAVWECDDAEVVDLDSSTGVIKPLKAGTAKVTLTVYKTDKTVDAVIGEWTVTVKAAPVVKPAPAKPTSFKVKNVKKKTAKLSWKAAANAEGYEVYRSTKKKKGFKKVATVTGNSYKNKKLKKGKTYYYKVKSFNVVNGNKVYSGFSAVKKVKIKK